jgi:hypothetical protein
MTATETIDAFCKLIAQQDYSALQDHYVRATESVMRYFAEYDTSDPDEFKRRVMADALEQIG